jgi:hypothetical protein
MIEDPLSEEILSGMWSAGDVVEVSADDGRAVFSKLQGLPASPEVEPRKKAAAARGLMPPRKSSGSSSGGSTSSGGVAGA